MNEKSLEISDMRRVKRKSYVTRVCKECTVGMVSSVAETSSKPRRFFKGFVLIVCLTGFFYQSTKFLTMVLQYPEVVDIAIRRPERIIKPAFTFCDNNWMKRSLFCKKYPEYCEEADENFCETYCGPNRTLVPKKEYFAGEHYVSREETIELHANLNEFLVDRNHWGIHEPETGPHLRLNTPFADNMVPCYSINSRVDSSEYPRTTENRQKIVWNFPIDQLSFYVEHNETFIPGMKAGMVFAIHSPFEAVNPFEKGIFMKPGRTYLIYVSMEEEILLEKPYLTDCINYTAQWEANGYKGPRTQEMCLHKCYMEISLACSNCTLENILYPHENKICPREFYHSCTVEYIDEQVVNCLQGCKKNCLQLRYEYKVQDRYFSQFDNKGGLLKELDNLVTVAVYLEDKEVKVLKHMPKYMFVEAFSTIGGFIGCWLGISLMEITDIFECFFRIIWYSFRRK